MSYGVEIAFFVLGVGLLATFLLWRYAQATLTAQGQQHFASAIAEVSSRLDKRVSNYQDLLRGFKGLYAATKSVERDEFAAYSRTIHLQDYPGLAGVGFIRRLRAADKDAFVQEVRRDNSLVSGGYPTFDVFPASGRAELFVITYVEPFSESAHGFDAGSDKVRRAAMERARDTTEPTATGRLTLIRDQVAPEPAFVIMFPIYQNGAPLVELEQRRAALLGFVAGGFRIGQLFEDLMAVGPLGAGLDLEVFDGKELTEDHLLYDVNPRRFNAATSWKHELHDVASLSVAGREWTLSFIAEPTFGLTLGERLRPIVVMWIELAFSLLLFGIVYSLGTSHANAVKLAERMTGTLRESERRYADLIDGAPDPIMTLDRLGRLQSANPAAERISGYSGRELIGRYFVRTGVLSGGSIAKAVQEFAFAAAGRERPPFELEMVRKNGSRLTVEANPCSIRQNGQVTGVQVIFRDITERKQVQERVQESAEQFRGLVSSIPGAVYRCACDSNWTMEFVSDAVQELSGYPASDFIANQMRSFVSIIHPEDQLMVEQTILDAVSRKAPYILEFRLQHADGTVREVQGRGRAMFSDEGQLLRLEGVLLDQTRRKELERAHQTQAQAIERTNQELLRQQQVMQSLLEDVQGSKVHLEEQGKQLSLANARLKELAVLKDEFVAKVSHELRTPLTSIKEGLSLLLDAALGALSAEQRDFLTTMDGDVDRLTELINNMLDLSKIEAGRMRLSRNRVEVRSLLETALRTYQPVLNHRTVTMDRGQVPPVFADAGRMHQVLTNLISNAVKFTPEDGRITFRTEQRNGMVAIAVHDNGPGISAEDLPKLFQKFSQVGEQGAGRPRGTGLGLVVCKELTELHGGRIEVASQLGHGTVFTILLPVYSDAFALAESFREVMELSGSEKGTSVGLVVILADRLLEHFRTPETRREALERVAESVRHNVHRGDIVLAQDPDRVAVLAATDAKGLEAIVRRLRGELLDGKRLEFGTALCPNHGTDAVTLLAYAAKVAGQAAPSSAEANGVEPKPAERKRRAAS